MGKLYYDIPLNEEYDEEGQPYEERVMSKEHFEKVKDWLPKEFAKCKIEKGFDGILEDKVASCTMKCIYKKTGDIMIPVARITIEFVTGLRVTSKVRQACWAEMDAQMSDGFGESYDRTKIPDGDGWQLKF